jgi:SRSO17 transposase
MLVPADATKALASYLDAIGVLLGSNTRKESFAVYVTGLMSSIERKTVETIAAMACTEPARMDAWHQQLLHVIGQAHWEDAPIRAFAAKYVLQAAGAQDRTDSWVIDDTGFPKQGKHSVGVQRQYSGTLGKIGNCQIGVSLVATYPNGQVPVDFALYLPETWAQDEMRRKRAKVPPNVQFQTKPELALAMVRQALDNGIARPRIVLADSAYGNNSHFRHELQAMNLRIGVGIQADTKMWRADKHGAKRGPETSAENLEQRAHFRRVTWAAGTKGPLTSKFAFVRVVVARDDSCADGWGKAMWLVIERPDDESEKVKYMLTDLPKVMSRRKIVWHLHQRYKTERVYEDMKVEFGLDHYEGRSFLGWHHHVTAALVCYNFVAAQQARLFPPQANEIGGCSAHHVAA